MQTPLNLYFQDLQVGQLRYQVGGELEFIYHTDWLGWEHAFPVSLSLPLKAKPHIGNNVTTVFDNLLPDKVETRLRLSEIVEANGYDVYSLLAKIGRDCAGAIQLLPEGEEPTSNEAVKGRSIDDQNIAEMLNNLSTLPLGIGPSEDFRITLAGAQEKTALLFWKDKWHIPEQASPTTHIIKPEIGILNNGLNLTQSVDNEFFCLTLLKNFGIPTANAKICVFQKKKALAVERFDRTWKDDNCLLRLPQEDCCQALSVPPMTKYQADGGPSMKRILNLLKSSDKPKRNQKLFLKTQIMFWLIGAPDGHAKNFSLMLKPGGNFSLAPIYDVMSVQPAIDQQQLRLNQVKLAMSVGNRRHYVIEEIVSRHFEQTAIATGNNPRLISKLLEEIKDKKKQAISATFNALPSNFPMKIADSIINSLEKRLYQP